MRLRASPPGAAAAGRGRLQAPASRPAFPRQRQAGSPRRGGGPPAARPLPRGAAGVESESEPAPRTLRRGGVGVVVAGEEATGGWVAGGAVSALHPARGPRTPPELPGASLKAAPARLFSPFFVTL